MNHFDLIIVGAGAAGQMAAIAAASNVAKVALIEQMTQPGLKILASGGSRCNLTNLAPLEDYEKLFGRQGRFIRHAMYTMSPEMLRDFFADLSVPTKVEEGTTKVFPASNKAMHVQAALRRRYENLGVTLRTSATAEKLLINDGQLKGIALASGNEIFAPKVILACGGRSWPELGGNGGGYALAAQAGHNIDSPTPALVPLVAAEPFISKLAGVAISNIRIAIDLPKHNKKPITGDVLFTHRGLSGPAVLDISATVCELLAEHKPLILHLALVGEMDTSDWERTLDTWRNQAGKKQLSNLLKQHLPIALIAVLMSQADIQPLTTPAQLTSQSRRKLIELLTRFPLTITSSEGFKTAYATRGGVRLKEIDSKTMQSRCLDGLYVTGELLNLDGPTGGYNLQWAFASGYLAGLSAVE